MLALSADDVDADQPLQDAAVGQALDLAAVRAQLELVELVVVMQGGREIVDKRLIVIPVLQEGLRQLLGIRWRGSGFRPLPRWTRPLASISNSPAIARSGPVSS